MGTTVNQNMSGFGDGSVIPNLRGLLPKETLVLFDGKRAEGAELDVVHPDGSITLHGTVLFTGSVNGKSGTLLFSYEGIGNAVTGHETLRFVGREGLAISRAYMQT